MKNLILKSKIFQLVTLKDVNDINSFLSTKNLIISRVERMDEIYCVIYYFLKGK
jgi:hypothetical protein